MAAPGFARVRRARTRAAEYGLVLLALGMAWALKAWYSRAGFEDLRWVLAPTRRLVEWLTGAAFAPEAGEGYLSRDRLYLIAPACAGVNFMIAAFASLACGLAHTRTTLRGHAALLVGSALAAYVVTLLANATRIAIAMQLHDTGASLGPLTPGRLHELAGVAVYFLFLCALFAAGARLAGARHELAP
jgi:exosortase K